MPCWSFSAILGAGAPISVEVAGIVVRRRSEVDELMHSVFSQHHLCRSIWPRAPPDGEALGGEGKP